ncbi:MAG: hypothetical protein JJT99_14915 [Rhodobacteraceae bacterium]|nr:hypothetical protein [Paracoccaceae bacterium]
MAKRTAKSNPCLEQLIAKAAPALMCDFLSHSDFANLGLGVIIESERHLSGAISEIRRKPGASIFPIEQAASEILDQSEDVPDRLALRIVEERKDGDFITRYRKTEGSVNRAILRWAWAPAVFMEVDRTWRFQRFRETGKYYEGRFVDLPIRLSPDDIDCDQLEKEIELKLGLTEGCNVNIWRDLSIDSGSDSIILLVTTGGQNVRVREWKKGLEPRPLDYQPVDEFLISYTPSRGMIEVCAQDPVARRVLGETFAKEILNVDLLTRPLSWEVYNLWRFRETVELDVPAHLEGRVLATSVIEASITAGFKGQTFSAKCGPKDDMRPFAERLLSAVRGLPGAGRIVRVLIHVTYMPHGKERTSSFSFALSGKNRSTIAGLRQRERISIANALMEHWKVVEKYQSLTGLEVGTALPNILRLLDHAPGPVEADMIEGLGGDIALLNKASIIVRRGLADVVLLEDELWDLGDNAILKEDGSVAAVDSEKREGPTIPRKIVEQYEIRTDEILHEILSAMTFLKRTGRRVSETKNLWRVGNAEIESSTVPVWIARNLNDGEVCAEVDTALRKLSDLPQGVILATGESPFQCLGCHVVIPISSCLGPSKEADPELLKEEFFVGRALAAAGERARLLQVGTTLAKLVVPGKGEIVVNGKTRVDATRLLVDAANAGGLSVPTGDICGDRMDHPRQVYGTALWKDLHPKFIESGGRGSWRIAR